MKHLFKGNLELDQGNYKLEAYDTYCVVTDSQGNEVYYEDSKGYWYKSEYDSQGNEVYFENSNGYWYKSGYDEQGNEVYFEDSCGIVIDNRSKRKVTVELTEEQLKKVKEILGDSL
jgi:uncharacterized protein YrzB (UPF0473 family)